MSTDNITPKRICNNCGIEYPLTTEFYRLRDKWFSRKCRSCERESAIRYYEDNKESVLEKKRLDRLARPEIYAARDALRMLLNPEKERERYRVYHAKNRIKRNKEAREWRKVNSGRVKDYNIIYYQDNKESKIHRSKLIYYLNHPHYLMLAKKAHSKRRAIMANVVGSHTTEDLQRLYEEQDGQCAYCGIRLFWSIPGDIHVDHIQPITRNGSNNVDNLALTCAHCNLSKHDKTLDEWIARRGW